MQLTKREREILALTLAGEIDPRQSPYNRAGTRQEMANILESIRSRFLSQSPASFGKTGLRDPKTGKIVGSLSGYNSIADVALQESQYSTWNKREYRNTARAQYAKLHQKPVINQAITDFFSGVLKPTQRGITHYFNPDVVTPSWSKKINFVGQVGPHTFYTDPNVRTGARTGITRVNKNSSPEEIKALQTALRASGAVNAYGRNKGQPIAVDGDYGKNTAAAVLGFQKMAGISVDGDVGPQTINSLGLNRDNYLPEKSVQAPAAAPTRRGVANTSGVVDDRLGVLSSARPTVSSGGIPNINTLAALSAGRPPQRVQLSGALRANVSPAHLQPRATLPQPAATLTKAQTAGTASGQILARGGPINVPITPAARGQSVVPSPSATASPGGALNAARQAVRNAPPVPRAPNTGPFANYQSPITAPTFRAPSQQQIDGARRTAGHLAQHAAMSAPSPAATRALMGVNINQQRNPAVETAAARYAATLTPSLSASRETLRTPRAATASYVDPRLTQMSEQRRLSRPRGEETTTGTYDGRLATLPTPNVVFDGRARYQAPPTGLRISGNAYMATPPRQGPPMPPIIQPPAAPPPTQPRTQTGTTFRQMPGSVTLGVNDPNFAQKAVGAIGSLVKSGIFSSPMTGNPGGWLAGGGFNQAARSYGPNEARASFLAGQLARMGPSPKTLSPTQRNTGFGPSPKGSGGGTRGGGNNYGNPNFGNRVRGGPGSGSYTGRSSR